MNAVASDPLQGDVVRGSGGVRKVRIAGSGKGKSGGFRVMVAYLGEDVPVYLLAVLNKRDRQNFTDAQVTAMKAITGQIRAGKTEQHDR